MLSWLDTFRHHIVFRSIKMEGIVTWYRPQRGYGYIYGSDKQDYFVYHDEIQMSGFRKLLVGDRVTFSPEITEKGLRARNVKKIEKISNIP